MNNIKKSRSTDMSILLATLAERELSIYDLATLSTVPRGSIYTYTSGRQAMPETNCLKIADALKMDVNELFPDLNPDFDYDLSVKKNTSGNSHLKDGGLKENESEEKIIKGLQIKNFMSGLTALFNEDNIIHVNLIKDNIGNAVEQYQFTDVEQVFVSTGIKTIGLELDKIFFKLDKFLMQKNEISSNRNVYDFNGELHVSILSLGNQFMLCHGTKIGKLIFI